MDPYYRLHLSGPSRLLLVHSGYWSCRPTVNLDYDGHSARAS